MTSPVVAVPPSIAIPQPTTGPTAGLALNDPSTQIMLTSWLGAAAKAISDWQGIGHLSAASLGLIAAAVAVTIATLLAKHVLSASLARTLVADAVTQNLPPAAPQTPADLLAAAKVAVEALASSVATPKS